ncbi:hypothetical protein GOP47_0021012 [Adiantum capillus-veneris]|uniref:Uncharacterized protein n=1 Tax=Adiantum capillus-veneris TaxID=13818 RepID=A0A9D4Z894_ADICA|nr:hypothetical protein GOP47_0021012 [Adiantum capillus-veneris]
MLGLRGKQKKKKKAIKCCSGLHGQIIRINSDNAIMRLASNHEEHLHYNNVINETDGIFVVSVGGLHHCGINYALNGQESDYQSSPSSRLGREIIAAQNSKRINKALSTNDEKLQLSLEAVFTPKHMRLPHQYSFLSKDYSTFSYYFSPTRSSCSCSNAFIFFLLRSGSLRDLITREVLIAPLLLVLLQFTVTIEEATHKLQ